MGTLPEEFASFKHVNQSLINLEGFDEIRDSMSHFILPEVVVVFLVNRNENVTTGSQRPWTGRILEM